MDASFELQGIRFTWNFEKASSNLSKHGVAFEIACEAFFDPFVQVVDAGSGHSEHRQAVLGLTTAWNLLFVVFVEHDDVLRIVSARVATAAERKLYEDQ